MSAEGTRVGQVETTHLLVKETGIRVNVRNEPHAQTNHYIKQSRPYFPNTKLPTYLYCPYFYLLSSVVFLGTFFGFMSVLPIIGAPKELPLGFFIACVVFFSIYCQHEWVNQKSLPVILKQPVFEGQRIANWFYEVTITELKGMALENYQAGIGFVEVTQGKIKFQAFNKTAVTRISVAKYKSRVMLFLFFVTSVSNLVFTVLAYQSRLIL